MSDSERQDSGARPAERYASGIEGREAEFGASVALAMRTLQNQSFYPHEVNDALVKLCFVMLQFAKKHAIGHEFNAGTSGNIGLVPYLITNDVTERHVELVRDTLRHRVRGDTTRLRAANHHMSRLAWTSTLRHLTAALSSV